MKDQLINALQLKAQIEPGFKKFIDTMKEENIGIIYHYYNSLDMTMDVVIEASDL